MFGIKKRLSFYRQKKFYASLFKECGVKTVFDVGANMGTKTKLFLKIGCRVVAIEPVDSCYPFLKTLQKDFPDLVIEKVGMSDSEGNKKIAIGSHSEISTFSEKAVRVFGAGGILKWDKEEQVETKTFQSLAAKHFYPDFLKLDCEGWDYTIIKSLEAPLRLLEFEYTEPFREEAVSSIKHLDALSPAIFNFSPYENAQFYYEEWMTANEMIHELLGLDNSIRHGNIFVKTFTT